MKTVCGLAKGSRMHLPDSDALGKIGQTDPKSSKKRHSELIPRGPNQLPGPGMALRYPLHMNLPRIGSHRTAAYRPPTTDAVIKALV